MILTLPEKLFASKVYGPWRQKPLLENPASLMEGRIPQVNAPEVIISDNISAYGVSHEYRAFDEARFHPADIPNYEAAFAIGRGCCGNVAI
jgi:hypothetical protein